MKTHHLLILALASAVWIPSPAAAARRILFRGSEAVAIASAGVPGSGYAGLPANPTNLSASCPTCVPGGTADANFGAGVPNQIVTFLHPFTNQAVTIPLTLPVGKPRIVTRRDRIIYDYGLLRDKVVVIFRPDGLVEVAYRGM